MEQQLFELLEVVNVDRAAVGLVPITQNLYETEFGLRHNLDAARKKLTFDFLSRKAKGQLRKPDTQEFMKERANLDIPGFGGDDEDRARITGDVAPRLEHARNLPMAAKTKKGQNRPVVRTRKPSTTPVVEPIRMVHGDEAEKLLIDAGVDKDEAALVALKNAVFTRGNGKFVSVPHQKGIIDDDISIEEEVIYAIEQQITIMNQYISVAQAAGMSTIQLRSDLLGYQNEVQKRRTDTQNLKNAMALTPGAEGTTKDQQEMAHDALNTLEIAANKLPEWRRADDDGNQRWFRAHLDVRKLADSEEAGNSIRDGNVMNLNPDIYYVQLSTLMDPTMPTNLKIVGRYAINHELGHMTDGSEEWGSVTRPDVWEAAKATGMMTPYGSSNLFEGYAEAFTSWLARNKNDPIARIYAKAFEWDEPSRGVQPDAPGKVRFFTQAEMKELEKRVQDAVDAGDQTAILYAKQLVKAHNIGDAQMMRSIFDLLKKRLAAI